MAGISLAETFSPRFNEVNSHQTVKVSKMKYAWINGY
jgi:hypothetical protein